MLSTLSYQVLGRIQDDPLLLETLMQTENV